MDDSKALGPDSNFAAIVHEVAACLAVKRGVRSFPLGVRPRVERVVELVLGLLFPHFTEIQDSEESELTIEIGELTRLLVELEERLWPESTVSPYETIGKFIRALPDIEQALRWDASAIFAGDPASDSIDEVIATYPGFQAIAVYRIAHVLDSLGFPLLPRMLSEYAHRVTGIDIHPSATIGRSFVIDHGTGIVIGATTIIGNQVKLYQGVTLGALSVQKGLAETKRHPTLEDNVVVYANATILGGDTVIGHDSIVAGGAWVTEAIPAYSMVNRHSDVRARRPGTEPEIEFFI